MLGRRHLRSILAGKVLADVGGGSAVGIECTVIAKLVLVDVEIAGERGPRGPTKRAMRISSAGFQVSMKRNFNTNTNIFEIEKNKVNALTFLRRRWLGQVGG